ncbi:hypothetical protein FRC12_002549 [Ceratobasidium sp. 428]|nr:hypothetical protein FRC12_002549 [Ceratobasidium sp. 428]
MGQRLSLKVCTVTTGDLQLVLPGQTPYVAATATAANEATREAIEHTLQFGDKFEFINLGNFRENPAHSVYRMKKRQSSIPEIVRLSPDKNRFRCFTLVLVDSRPIGQLVLSILRRSFAPHLRPKIQLYHAFRSNNAKKILAYGFEEEYGYGIQICTEILTMTCTGVDFRKTGLVIQVEVPTDPETIAQRGGRAGRDKSMKADLVTMAQESMFYDSKEGKKQLKK